MNPRDVAVVAEYEVTEAVRSKRVLILMLLYVGGAVAGSMIFIEMLRSVEATLADKLALSTAGAPGAMTQALMQSPEFVDLVEKLVDDRDVALNLVSKPPLALFYGWLAMTFVPTVVVLTASDTVSTELGSGATRFQLLRVNRLTYSVGKLLGQSALMLGSVLAGACAVWITGSLRMSAFESLPTATALLSLSLRASIMGFAYVGLSVGVSHLTRSIPLSRAFGLFALIGVAALSGLTSLLRVTDYASLAETVRVLLPGPHELDLWRPDLVDLLPGASMLVALGIGYFALGYLYRARRDA